MMSGVVFCLLSVAMLLKQVMCLFDSLDWHLCHRSSPLNNAQCWNDLCLRFGKAFAGWARIEENCFDKCTLRREQSQWKTSNPEISLIDPAASFFLGFRRRRHSSSIISYFSCFPTYPSNTYLIYDTSHVHFPFDLNILVRDGTDLNSGLSFDWQNVTGKPQGAAKGGGRQAGQQHVRRVRNPPTDLGDLNPASYCRGKDPRRSCRYCRCFRVLHVLGSPSKPGNSCLFRPICDARWL